MPLKSKSSKRKQRKPKRRSIEEQSKRRSIEELFLVQLQPVQKELAALVDEIRSAQYGNDNIGRALANLESDVRTLIIHLIKTDYPELKPEFELKPGYNELSPDKRGENQ